METEREIRQRVGKHGRVECMLPKGLTEPQIKSRRLLLKELADEMAHIEEESKAAVALLTRLAKAKTRDDVDKLAKAVRRFISEPKGSPAKKDVGITFGMFANRWVNGELADENPRYVERLSEQTVRVNRCRVRVLNAVIGKVPLSDFTKADADKAMASLDKGLSNTSYRHYAQVIQTVIRTAVHPFNIIDKSPLPDKFLPPTGAPPSYPILYPEDVTLLLRCKKVKMWKRVLYCIALFEGIRESHMLRAKWSWVNFRDGMLTIDPGKNNAEARTWHLNSGVLEVLRWFKEQTDGEGYIFPQLTANEKLKLAEELREDLVSAGVTRDIRPDLFGDVKGQMPVRFQDLRATFVSLHLAMGPASGWTEVEVMIRTGHTSTKVLHHHYARRIGLAKSIIKAKGPLLPADVAMGLRKPEKAPGGGGKGGGKKRGGS